MRIYQSTAALVAAAALLLAAPLAAQERIPLRLVPTPNQTIKTETRQEMRMVAEQPMPINLRMNGVTATTLVLGSRDAAGILTGKLTYDDISATVTMNDNPITPPTPTLKGTTITIEYAADGTPRLPSGSGADLALQSFFNVAAASMPADATIGVGESTTLPIRVAVPGTQSAVEGTMRVKLVSIDRDGDDRIATFEQAIDSTFTPENTPVATTVTMKGNGTARWDLTHGVATTQDLLMDYGLSASAAGQTMTMTGTAKFTTIATRQPTTP